MLIARGRLNFSLAAEDWLEQALGYPGVRLLELSPRIALKSAQLPGNFHKDPADQMIVATALVLDCPLMTMDTRVLNYPHVKLVP
jgi:PIN domain nuclease of toxin-antitoxin system